MDITPEQCLEVRAALPLYVGADLDPEEMETVGAHLARCASCDGLHQSALAARAVLVEGLQRHATRPGPSIWEGIRAQLASDVPALSRRVDSPVLRPHVARWGLRRMGVGAAAAAAALVLCFGLAHLAQPELTGAPSAHGSPAVASTLVTGITGGLPVAGGDSNVVPVRTADDTLGTKPGGLMHVGRTGTPLFQDAVEVYVDQGTFSTRGVLPQPQATELTGSAPQLMRDRR